MSRCSQRVCKTWQPCVTEYISAVQILQRTVGHLRRALQLRGARTTGATAMSSGMTTRMMTRMSALTRSRIVPGLANAICLSFSAPVARAFGNTLKAHFSVGRCNKDHSPNWAPILKSRWYLSGSIHVCAALRICKRDASVFPFLLLLILGKAYE